MATESVTEQYLISDHKDESDENWNVHLEDGLDENVDVVKDGRLAWMVCAAGFLLQVLIVGMLHVFGVFFVAFIKEFNKTKGEVAWVGSAAYGLSMAFGPVTGMLVNRYGNRPVTMAGCLICAMSALVSSFAPSVEMLFLTYSVFYGIGTSLAYTPTMTIAQDYFEKYVSEATGIMTAGSSTGTLILAPLTQYLVDSHGWRVAFRVFTGTCLFTVLCASAFRPTTRKQLNPVQKIRKSPLRMLMQELRLWKDRVFIVWVAGITLVMFGYYIPYVHLVSYADDVGVSPDKGSILVMLLGGSTAVGRILFGKIVQYGFLNRLHMHQISMVITGTGAMILPLITSFSGLAAYVVCVGLVDGCFVVLLPLLTAALVGSQRTVVAWGFLVGASSVTFTLGPPVAGWINDATGTYKIAFHVAGVPIIAGALVLFLIPWAQRTSTRSNVLEVVNVNPPSDAYVVSPDQSPESTALSSPVCGTHRASAPPQNDFSNCTVSSTRKVSLTMTNILDASYERLPTVPTQERVKAATTSTTTLGTTATVRKTVPYGVTSLPANLNLPSSTEKAVSDLDRRQAGLKSYSNNTASLSARLQKEMFQRQKQLALSTGRARAKSWSESGQGYSDGIHPPQVTKSERYRDLMSFEPRSQLAVDHADKIRGLAWGRGNMRYRQTSSSDLTQDGTTSSVSSDRNYQADISQQQSEDSLVNLFGSLGVTQQPTDPFQSELNDLTNLSQAPGSFSNQPVLPSGRPIVIPDSSDDTEESPEVPTSSGFENSQCGSITVAQTGTPVHMNSSLSHSVSSLEKLPTITEHRTFHACSSSESTEVTPDGVSDLIKATLIPS